MLYYKQEDNRPQQFVSSQSAYASWDTIARNTLANQRRPMDSLLGCVREGGLPIHRNGKSALCSSKFWGGFSMPRLFAILKNKSQQCQNEHTKGHKVFKIVVLHRHHLASLREFRQCHPASGSHQTNRLRLSGCYHMGRIHQSASSFGLASWMRPQHGCLA